LNQQLNREDETCVLNQQVNKRGWYFWDKSLGT